jgi:hypothetical protein
VKAASSRVACVGSCLLCVISSGVHTSQAAELPAPSRAHPWIEIAQNSGYMAVRMEKPGVGDSVGPPAPRSILSASLPPAGPLTLRLWRCLALIPRGWLSSA